MAIFEQPLSLDIEWWILDLVVQFTLVWSGEGLTDLNYVIFLIILKLRVTGPLYDRHRSWRC